MPAPRTFLTVARRRLLGLAAAGLAGLALSGGAAAQTQGTDEHRLVSVGGDVTEIVYALGAGDRLVAVDSTSLYPPEAERLPDVGYLRQLSAEPILSLQPTQVLVTADAGPPSALDQLRAAGVAVTTIPDEPTPHGVVRKVEQVAEELGLPQRGRELAGHLRTRFRTLADELAGVSDRPRVLLLLAIGRGAPMTAGADTAAHGIIRLGGGVNAVDGFNGYKPLSSEAVVNAAPDVILATRRTLQQMGGRKAVLSRPELAATPAGRQDRLVVMDGLLLLGFGPRTPAAAAELARALHPQLDLRDPDGSARDAGDD